MTKGISKTVVNKKSIFKGTNKVIVRVALILSILAFILIGMIILTVNSANNLMNIEKHPISNVPSNILPSYSTCSFESFDEQINLSGWFFKCENPISTVIVVHDTGSNRLPFGVNMIDLLELLLENKYNVFLFDLRNSGESEGDISAYGYLEWQDVLGAIKQVKKISVTTDVVLLGIGTGVTSCVKAYNNLPDANISDTDLYNYTKNIRDLGFDKSYIKAMIFDSPAKNSDDYIKPLVARNEFLGTITQNFVPYAIRVSAGVTGSVNLAAEISRLPVPVCIIYGGHDTFIGTDKITKLINERNRLSSNITKSVMIPGANYLESFKINEDLYNSTVIDFLHSYLG